MANDNLPLHFSFQFDSFVSNESTPKPSINSISLPHSSQGIHHCLIKESPDNKTMKQNH